jgi:hypothetical protein
MAVHACGSLALGFNDVSVFFQAAAVANASIFEAKAAAAVAELVQLKSITALPMCDQPRCLQGLRALVAQLQATVVSLEQRARQRSALLDAAQCVTPIRCACVFRVGDVLLFLW